VYVNLVRDKETGKSRGFAFLKYEDQRSTDLAVDNLGGATIMGRVLKVDHTRYKRKDEEEEMERERAMNEHTSRNDGDQGGRRSSRDGSPELKRPLLAEERELAALIRDHDEEDPMKEYLVQEKKEEVAKALARLAKKGSRKNHHHHHHRKHRSRRHSRYSSPEEERKKTHGSGRYSDDSQSDEERRREEFRRHRRRSRSP
jgi:RNA-binding motif X-linked protein 2